MSTLFLVRHAQASFLQSDYDRLSELGHRQAAELGRHWAELGVAPHRVYSGPRRRQQHTAELVGEAMRAAGAAFPEIVVLEELDEYRAEEILQLHAPALAARHAELARLLGELGSAVDRGARGRAFDRVLQRVLRLWASGELDASESESFVAYRRRVAHALELLTEDAGSGRQIAAFSSGGTIGAIVGGVLGANAETALELGWNVENASVTEILFSGSRRTLRRFNALGHLPDPATWTQR